MSHPDGRDGVTYHVLSADDHASYEAKLDLLRAESAARQEEIDELREQLDFTAGAHVVSIQDRLRLKDEAQALRARFGAECEKLSERIRELEHENTRLRALVYGGGLS